MNSFTDFVPEQDVRTAGFCINEADSYGERWVPEHFVQIAGSVLAKRHCTMYVRVQRRRQEFERGTPCQTIGDVIAMTGSVRGRTRSPSRRMSCVRRHARANSAKQAIMRSRDQPPRDSGVVTLKFITAALRLLEEVRPRKVAMLSHFLNH